MVASQEMSGGTEDGNVAALAASDNQQSIASVANGAYAMSAADREKKQGHQKMHRVVKLKAVPTKS